MHYLHFLSFKEAFNQKILYKLFWKCFEKCTHKLRVPINTFSYAVKMDKLTVQTPVAAWNSWWFMFQSSLQTLTVLSKIFNPIGNQIVISYPSEGTLPFWGANRQIPVRTMTGSAGTLWGWCNSTVSRNPRQLLLHRTQLGCCRGQEKDKCCLQEKDKCCFPVSPHHRGGFTRKNWCSSAECRLSSSDITPAL